MPSRLANSFTIASLALPFSGAAVTFTIRRPLRTPATSLFLALGKARTFSKTPSLTCWIGPSSAGSRLINVAVWRDVGQLLWADALHFVQCVDISERAVLVAVTDDAAG